MRKYVMPLVLLTAATILSACGGKKLSATDILTMSADAMGQIETVQFSLEREGEPVMVELAPGTSVTISGATGAFQAPDSAHALVSVGLSGLVAEADVLWTGGTTYYKLPPLIPTYQEIELADFDVANVFTGDDSLSGLMRTGLDNVLLADEEDLEGQPTYLIQANARAAALQRLLGAAVMPETADVVLWIHRDTFLVVRAVVSDDAGNTWQLDLFSYGEAVEIPQP